MIGEQPPAIRTIRKWPVKNIHGLIPCIPLFNRTAVSSKIPGRFKATADLVKTGNKLPERYSKGSWVLGSWYHEPQLDPSQAWRGILQAACDTVNISHHSIFVL